MKLLFLTASLRTMILVININKHDEKYKNVIIMPSNIDHNKLGYYKSKNK